MGEKISRPSAEGSYLRERLFALLDKGRKKPVVWVSGPGGSGKTQLVSSYIESLQLPNIWYQLDRGDADVASFFYYIGQAVNNASSRTKKPLPLLTPEYLTGLSQFTLRFFEELFDRMKKPGLLVLDGFHEVPEHTPLQRVLIDGISRVPSELSMVILSRREPPPIFSRLRATKRFVIIGREQLRFTQEEFTKVAGILGGGMLTPEVLNDLHTRLEGWIAGLILILEQLRLAGPAPCHVPVGAPQEIFDFFAGEIWARTGPEMRDFLLKTAFLSEITPGLAEDLTGIHRSERILSYLSDFNLFTLCLSRNPPRYRYHSLFKEFLLHKAKETFNPLSLKYLQSRAAGQLVREGEVESAARLLLEAREWEDLIGLILQVSRDFIAQGRFQTLLGWLEALPREYLERDPWLKYWFGTCALQIGRPDARHVLTEAHEALSRSDDLEGMWLSWSAITAFFPYQWRNHQDIEGWVDRFFQIYSEKGEFPSEEIEIQAVHGILWMLLFLRPFPEEIGPWIKRVQSLLERPLHKDHALMLYNPLTCYLVLSGRLKEAMALSEQVLPSLEDPEVSPLPRLLLQAWFAFINTLAGDIAGGIEITEKGLHEASVSGVRGVDASICAQAAYAALSEGDTDTAQTYLERYRSMIDPANILQGCQLRCLEGWLALSLGDLPLAVHLTRQSYRFGVKSGFPFYEAFGSLSLIHVLIEEGKFTEAEEKAERVIQIAERMGSRHIQQMIYMALAYLYLKRGDEQKCHESLRRFLASGKEGGLFNSLMWRPGVISVLCARALEAGIEEEYVGDLIRRRALKPEGELNHLGNWPWPMKIHTLGRFGLIIEGEPIRFSGKAQQRPLDLLKALLSFGGRDVATENLMDALWPDSEGDAAKKAFDITLHRLRKLVMVNEAVRLREGNLTLNPELCWVDVWAFERGFNSADTVPDDSFCREACRTVELYRGVFLPNEESKAWTVPLREKTRSKYLRLVNRIGTHLAEKREYDRAKEFYLRALDLNPLSEDLYRNLMVCYEKLGQKCEGLAVYQRCCSVLDATFGVQPTRETKTLYSRLMS